MYIILFFIAVFLRLNSKIRDTSPNHGGFENYFRKTKLKTWPWPEITNLKDQRFNNLSIAPTNGKGMDWLAGIRQAQQAGNFRVAARAGTPG
jgi:hypothetical protein